MEIYYQLKMNKEGRNNSMNMGSISLDTEKSTALKNQLTAVSEDDGDIYESHISNPTK